MESVSVQTLRRWERTIQRSPQCCQHTMLIQKNPVGGYLLLCLSLEEDHPDNAGLEQSQGPGYERFLGHPECECCKNAEYRFLLGSVGNLVQNWSRANFSFEALHDVMKVAEGYFTVRSTALLTKLPQNDFLITAEFVKHCEKGCWRSEIDSVGNGLRPLIPGFPFTRQFRECNSRIRSILTQEIQPFVAALHSTVAIRILGDDGGPTGTVQVEWSPQRGINLPTNFQRICFPENHTLDDYFRMVRSGLNVTVFIMMPDTEGGQGVDIQPLPQFCSLSWRQVYQRLEHNLGSGQWKYKWQDPRSPEVLQLPVLLFQVLSVRPAPLGAVIC